MDKFNEKSHKDNCESILRKAFEKLLKEIFEDDRKDEHDCGCHS